MDTDILIKGKKVISSPQNGYRYFSKLCFCTLVPIRQRVNVIFIDLSDDSFVITEFEYFFTIFVYDLSVLTCYFVFINYSNFTDLFFDYPL